MINDLLLLTKIRFGFINANLIIINIMKTEIGDNYLTAELIILGKDQKISLIFHGTYVCHQAYNA